MLLLLLDSSEFSSKIVFTSKAAKGLGDSFKDGPKRPPDAALTTELGIELDKFSLNKLRVETSSFHGVRSIRGMEMASHGTIGFLNINYDNKSVKSLQMQIYSHM